MKLWETREGGDAVDLEVAAFSSAEDLAADRVLFLFDVTATLAHVRGLRRIGVLTSEDELELERGLAALRDDCAAGRFVVDERFEDGHSAIEHYLTERSGAVGRRVHAGRSRNDQVQVALRLYTKDRLGCLAGMLDRTARLLLDRAAETAALVMPGYTHLQPAVPSSVGLWLAGTAEGLVDDVELAASTERWVDASPLGTGAGFGVNLPLDREGVARDLGFARVAWNPVAVQNARGKLELIVLGVFEAALLDARRFAWDLSLYSMAELGFVSLPDVYTTGSSLMPNKRNPDVVELLRAAHGQVAGARVEIGGTLSLPSGYHRDLQRTKAAYVRAVEGALAATSIFSRLTRDVRFDAERLRAAIRPEMFATDRAVALAATGVPFRDAYAAVKAGFENGVENAASASGALPTPEDSLVARVSPGANADLKLDAIRARLDALGGGR